MALHGYLYTYFKNIKYGQDDQRVYFAISEDGFHFHEINNNKPMIVSDKGTKALRDPHIFKNEIDDYYYILSTDLDVNTNRWKEFKTKGSKSIFVSKSKDLINWDNELIKVCDDSIGCVWAPKVCFDDSEKEYVVYFSGGEIKTGDMKVYYVRTKDFKSFSEPKILIDKYLNTKKKKYAYSILPFSPKFITHIDSTTIQIDDEYYRFTKNEACKIIQEEHSKNICDNFEIITNCVAGEIGVEGPGVYKIIDQNIYVLMMDGYIKPNKGVGYFPLIATKDGIKRGIFKRLSKEEYSYPPKSRHGSIIAIGEEDFNRLKNL